MQISRLFRAEGCERTFADGENIRVFLEVFLSTKTISFAFNEDKALSLTFYGLA